MLKSTLSELQCSNLGVPYGPLTQPASLTICGEMPGCRPLWSTMACLTLQSDHLALIYLVNCGPFWTGYGQATVPAVPASIVGAWLSLTCVNANSGRRWRTSSTTARRQSSPAGWRLFMRLTTMPSFGFRIRRRKHSRNEMSGVKLIKHTSLIKLMTMFIPPSLSVTMTVWARPQATWVSCVLYGWSNGRAMGTGSIT